MSRAELTTASSFVSLRLALVDAAVYAAIATAAVLLWRLTRAYAAGLPAIAPWEFSFVEFGLAWLFTWWYARGLALTPRHERPALWRTFGFYGGLALIYAVLETRFEYLAEHQFFFNRMQRRGDARHWAVPDRARLARRDSSPRHATAARRACAAP